VIEPIENVEADHADDKLSAFVELERQVLTDMFYLESIHADSCWDQ
jgi:hypothetical protein